MTDTEIDVRRYWQAVAARWWLPVIGVIVGAAIGYALSLGGSDVWRGTALVYLGQPVTPSGAQVQSLSTNPATAGEIAGSGAAQRRVERAVGLERGALNGKVSVAAVKGNVSRLGQNPLVRVRVEGDSRKVAPAATALAREVVTGVSGYADAKIEVLEEAVAQGDAELARLDRQLDDASGSSAGFLLLRRGELADQLVTNKQNLALAREVEKGRVVQEAVPRKVTAQSRRNQIVVGAFLGLLLGVAAALVWESAGALRRR
jgi:choline dehydrogenase-like flavoprotein